MTELGFKGWAPAPPPPSLCWSGLQGVTVGGLSLGGGEPVSVCIATGDCSRGILQYTAQTCCECLGGARRASLRGGSGGIQRQLCGASSAYVQPGRLVPGGERALHKALHNGAR